MRTTLTATLLALPLLLASMAASAADPVVGRWKTIDDETGKAKSIVEITQNSNGTFSGRITEILSSDKGPNPICDKCKDDRKNKPVKGMEIVRGMKKEGAGYAGGTILRPGDGKIFKSKMQLLEGGKKLEVSGCVSFICKEQVWIRQ
jgi:uncharacterized protein (DUF2147 family)